MTTPTKGEVEQRLQGVRREIRKKRSELKILEHQNDQLSVMLMTGDFSGFRPRLLPMRRTKLLTTLELIASEPARWWSIKDLVEAMGEVDGRLVRDNMRSRVAELRRRYDGLRRKDGKYKVAKDALRRLKKRNSSDL